MTDLQEFLALLDRFGIVAAQSPIDDGGTDVLISEVYFVDSDGKSHLYCVGGEVKSNARVTGYSSFYTSVVFDAEGAFVRWGAWE